MSFQMHSPGKKQGVCGTFTVATAYGRLNSTTNSNSNSSPAFYALTHTIDITILNTQDTKFKRSGELVRNRRKRARKGKIVPSSIIYGFDFDSQS